MPFYPPPGSPSRTLGSVDGPSSYPTGGFVVDLSNTYSDIQFFEPVIETIGALPPVRFEIIRNTPGPGKVTMRLYRIRYDRATSTITGRAQNPPTGVTVRNASGTNAQTVDAVGGSGGAHTVNQLYDHDHSISVTQTQTDTVGVEIAAGTNLSSARFRYNAIGT